MPRRVRLPGADELFRATATQVARDVGGSGESDGDPGFDHDHGIDPAVAGRNGDGRSGSGGRQRNGRRPSGRERHDEKITVYISPTELIDLEQSRVMLRANHGLGVDRGRIVREALSVVLADFEAKGADSILVRRLIG